MSAIFRGESKRVPITPTAAVTCGQILTNGFLIGVATSAIAASEAGEMQLEGDYDLSGTSITAKIGDLVYADVKTLAGDTITAAPVGITLEAVTSASSVRVRLLPTLAAQSVPSASAFDATSTYAVGDLVTKSNKTYRCKTAIAVAAAWDATKWEEIAAGGSVTI